MKFVKRGLCGILSLSITLSMIVVPIAAESNYYYKEDFESYDGASLPDGLSIEAEGRGASLTASLCEQDGSGNAISLKTGSGSISEDYAPAAAFSPDRSEGTVIFGFDVNFHEYNASNSSLLTLYLEGGQNIFFDYSSLVFRGDGSCGFGSQKTASFDKDTWYRAEIVFNFDEDNYSVRLTDKKTGETQAVVPTRAMLEEFKAAERIEYAEIGIAAPNAEIYLDNIEIFNVALPETVFPKAGQRLPRDGEFAFSADIPAGAKSAEFYIDGELADSIQVQEDGIYSINADLSALDAGRHTFAVGINNDANMMNQTTFNVTSDETALWGKTDFASESETQSFIDGLPAKIENSARLEVTGGKAIISGTEGDTLKLKLDDKAENRFQLTASIDIPEASELDVTFETEIGDTLNNSGKRLTKSNTYSWYFDFEDGSYTVFADGIPMDTGSFDGQLSSIKLALAGSGSLSAELDDVKIAAFAPIPGITAVKYVNSAGDELSCNDKVELNARLLRIYVDETLRADTVAGNVLINGVQADAVYNAERGAIDITLASLQSSTSYSVIIKNGIKSTTGIGMEQSSINFETAQMNFEIISPKADGKYGGDVECRATVPGKFSSLIFKLDGKQIKEFSPNSSESYSLTLGGRDIAYGEHTLTVQVVDEAKELTEKQVSFTVVKTGSSSLVFDFEDWDGTETMPANMKYIHHDFGDEAYVSKGEGRDGSAALKMGERLKNTMPGGLLSNVSYMQVETGEVSQRLTIEGDMRVSDVNSLLGYEFKDTSGNYGQIFVIRDGEIYGSGRSIDTDWHNIKTVIDFSTGSYTVYMDGAECTSGSMPISNTQYVRFIYKNQKADDTYILIDNMSYKVDVEYPLPGKTEYEETDGSFCDAGNGVSAETTKIRQYFTGKLDESSLNTNTVHVYSGADDLDIERIAFDSVENCLTVTLKDKLAGGAEGKLVITGDARFEDGESLGRRYEIPFYIIPSGIGLLGVTLKKGSISIETDRQLGNGDLISAELMLRNNTDENMPATVALSFYDGTVLAGIKRLSDTIDAGEVKRLVIPNVNIPYKDGMNIKVHICDSWENRIPLAAWDMSASGLGQTTDIETSKPSTEPTPTPSGKRVIINEAFETVNQVCAIAPKDNIMEICEENGNHFMHYVRTESINDAFADFYVPGGYLTNTDGYVVECDIRIVEMETGSGIEFLPIKSTAGNWGTVGKIDDKGAVTYAGTAFGSIEAGDFQRISLAFNNNTGLMTVYINGRPVGQPRAFDTAFEPGSYRVGILYRGGRAIFDLDNFRVYEGLEPKAELGEFSSVENFVSVMETPADAIGLVAADDLVVMANNGAYLTNGEKKYSAVKPYIEGDTIMAPISLIASVYGLGVLSDIGITVKNGSEYASLKETAACTGRHYYYDDRGFAVLSKEEFTLRNSDAVQVLDEPIDTLYRYLQFKRPSGAELAAKIIKNNPNHSHPRILGTAEDMQRVKDEVDINEALRKWDYNKDIAPLIDNPDPQKTINYWASSVIEDADGAIEQGPIKYQLIDTIMLKLSRRVADRMRRYTVAYLLTEDKKYVDAAWRDLEEVCTNYPDWDDYRNFLDAAEMAYAVAIGYDSFYNEFTNGQKKVLRDAVVAKAFEPALRAYQNMHPNGYWVNGDDNWTAVCPGGLMAAAIAMVDEEDTADICEVILGQTMQSFEYVMSLLYPDGAWYESISYFVYSTDFMMAGLGSLINATGEDFDIFNVPGIDNFANFSFALHGDAYGAFNFHDGSSGLQLNSSSLWLARQLGIDDIEDKFLEMWWPMSYWKEGKESLLFHYRIEDSGKKCSLSLDNFFRQANTGSMRQSWDRNSIWAGVHAGQNGIDHDHLDLGEFVFEWGGVRWVNDNGADSYTLPGYFATQGYDIYRKRPEANNCLVINPRTGYQGQSIKCTTELTNLVSKDRGAYMVFDLSKAYEADADKVTRGFMLGDDRRSLLVRDEVSGLQDNSELYWFMNLDSNYGVNATINADGKSATLTSNAGGKRQTVRVEFETDADEYELYTMKQIPLPTSPIVEGMADDSDKTKLVIKLKGSGDVGISVKLIPQTGDMDGIAPVDNTPVSEWNIPD